MIVGIVVMFGVNLDRYRATIDTSNAANWAPVGHPGPLITS